MKTDKSVVKENVIKYKTIRKFGEIEKPLVLTVETEVSEEEYKTYKHIESTLDQLEIMPGRNRVIYQLVLLEAIKEIKSKKPYIPMIDEFQDPKSDFYKKIESKYKVENSYDIITTKFKNKYATSTGNSLFGMAQYIIIESPKNRTSTINKNLSKQQIG